MIQLPLDACPHARHGYECEGVTDDAKSEDDLRVSAHKPDLAEVRAWFERMIKALKFAQMILIVVELIGRMRDLNTELTKRLAYLGRKRPRSETLKRLQQQLAFAFMDALVSDAPPTKPDAPKPPKPKESRRGRHPGRALLPAHLLRVEVENPVPPAQRICPLCGSEMTTVDHDPCEILEIEPARLIVLVRKDERVACPHDDTIVSANTPPELVERGKLGPKLIIESLSDKFIEHQPIERQCLRWSRTGVDIAPQTLGRSIGVAIDLFSPVAGLIHKQTRDWSLLATDATGLPVLDSDAPNGIRTGTMWCWIGGPWVTFFYSPSGDSDSVRRFLGEDLCRTVQCDGTNILSFLERAGGKRPGCWAHGRRGFAAAARAGDALALEGLEIIAGLFAIERASALADETHEQRKGRRVEYSTPILAKLRAWVDEKRGVIPPKTPLGKALGYLHRQWSRLIQFLADGHIPLTNNAVERELRRLVLGRKNWLFTWGDLGGERTANILTIIGTCIAQQVNPRAYLHLATKLLVEGWPQSKLRDILPDRLADAYPDLRTRRDEPPRPALPAPS